MTGAPDLNVNCQIFLMYLFLSVTKHFLEADFIYYVWGGGGGELKKCNITQIF